VDATAGVNEKLRGLLAQSADDADVADPDRKTNRQAAENAKTEKRKNKLDLRALKPIPAEVSWLRPETSFVCFRLGGLFLLGG
jgi:hypothetical protein